MRVWLDFSNSPHPLLFAPVALQLGQEGHEVLVTMRDNAQTVELTLERWPDAKLICGQSPQGKAAKAQTLARRIRALRRWAATAKPEVALSHNSYAQIVAARSLGIPAVTAMDFEHQPANHLAFRLARTVLVPEVFPTSALRRQGATHAKVIRYPGLKEELYIGDFEPDRAALGTIGLEPRPSVVVVVRAPPSRAIYHPSSNPLFNEALQVICGQPEIGCIVLARHPEQVDSIAALSLPNCIVPTSAIDSRSLIYSADVMVGAGGTMTREAALMGIPSWTAFAGKPPAVDAWLVRQNMLRRLGNPDELRDLEPRPNPPRTPGQLRKRATDIQRAIVRATLAAACSHGPEHRS